MKKELEQHPISILYIITKGGYYGGAQRYVNDLATYGTQHGHSITVAFGGSGLLEKQLAEQQVATVQLKSLERDVSIFADMKAGFEIFRLIRKVTPDVLHLNSSKVGAIGALAGRLHNLVERCKKIFRQDSHPTAIIFTGHGWALNEDRPDWQRFIIAFVHWITIVLSHKTIVVSRKTRDEVMRLPFIWNKLAVIHNGIAKIHSLTKKEALKRIFGEQQLPKERLVIGTIAELHKNKGLSYALDGLHILKKQTEHKFLFVVIGDGEERGSLEKQIEALGLKEEVFLAGYLQSASELLRCFDIFLFPSIKEGFPYAILEAGNIGLPIIATSVGGIPEVIDDMQSGILIHSKNPGEIARALKYMIEHKDKTEQFGKHIHAHITRQFTINEMAKKTFTLYQHESSQAKQKHPLHHSLEIEIPAL